MAEQQQIFDDARELWQTQVPTFEPDRLEGTVRILVHAALWRA